MKRKSTQIEKKLEENLEFLKMSSLEMTQIIKSKQRKDISDISENST